MMRSMGPVRQAGQPGLLVAAHPGVHRLADTPYRSATSVTGIRDIRTSNTA
jgi:hypothetical protein